MENVDGNEEDKKYDNYDSLLILLLKYFSFIHLRYHLIFSSTMEKFKKCYTKYCISLWHVAVTRVIRGPPRFLVSIPHLSAGHLPSPPPPSSPSAARSLPSSRAPWAGPGRVASVHEVKQVGHHPFCWRIFLEKVKKSSGTRTVMNMCNKSQRILCLLLELKVGSHPHDFRSIWGPSGVHDHDGSAWRSHGHRGMFFCFERGTTSLQILLLDLERSFKISLGSQSLLLGYLWYFVICSSVFSNFLFSPSEHHFFRQASRVKSQKTHGSPPAAASPESSVPCHLKRPQRPPTPWVLSPDADNNQDTPPCLFSYGPPVITLSYVVNMLSCQYIV